MYGALCQEALAQRPSAPSEEPRFYTLLTLEYLLSLAPGYLRWLAAAVVARRRGLFLRPDLPVAADAV